MIRILIALGVLLAAPAGAQLPSADFSFELEYAEGADGYTPSALNVTISSTLVCQMPSLDPTLRYTIDFEVDDDYSGLAIYTPAQYRIVSACVSELEYRWDSDLGVVAGPTVPTGQLLEIGITGTVTVSGMPVHDDPQNWNDFFTVKYRNATAPDSKPSGEPRAPAEETTPALTIPMVAVALLALARRR